MVILGLVIVSVKSNDLGLHLRLWIREFSCIDTHCQTSYRSQSRISIYTWSSTSSAVSPREVGVYTSKFLHCLAVDTNFTKYIHS